jgi:HK97 family phage major capsid protein
MAYSHTPYPKENFEKLMSAEISTDGGFGVPEFMSPEIIERLKSQQVLREAGIRSFTVPANFGNFVVPILESGATYTEIGETATSSLSTPQLGLKTASPKRVSVGIEISNRLIETNGVNLDDIIVDDVVEDGALRADFLGLKGSGTSFQPRGVVNTPGIGSVIAGSPDGGPVTLDLLIDLQKEVNEANSHLRRTAYIMHSNIFFQILKITENSQHVVASPYFPPGHQGRPPKQIWGERILTFNELPIDLTKASGTDLGEIFFADWSDLVMVMWGQMEVSMTREATHPTSGRSAFWNKVTGFMFDMEIDYYMRHAASAAVSTDVETQ